MEAEPSPDIAQEPVSDPEPIPEPETEPEPEPEPEWDFVLPEVNAPETLHATDADGNGMFMLGDLIGAVQKGATYATIQGYLRTTDQRAAMRNINGIVKGFPSMFYVVARNDEWLVRLFGSYGADVNVAHVKSGVPLLGFAIALAENIQADTTMMVETLLSLGATADVLPKAFYAPYLRDMHAAGPHEEELIDLEDKNKQWCTESVRGRLGRTINLSQRYYLDKSTKVLKPSWRHKQVAKLKRAEALLGINYFLIGQTVAANMLMRKFLSYMVLPKKKPLVMVFAGPSGHGKTELARRLGYLLSLDFLPVDCTTVSHERELFGPRAPMVGAEQGSPLNNFLARHTGQRAIVFLDEFEKTNQDVHKTLLIPFDNEGGEYEDRRNRTNVDCSKIIWILATNALDPTIKKFCEHNSAAIFDDTKPLAQEEALKRLASAIKDDFKEKFKPPLTGRITSFLPFLHFSPGEAAVIAHKYVNELDNKMRQPVNLAPGPEQKLFGNVRLRVPKDASVCKAIIMDGGYDVDLGARSIITAVDAKLEDLVVDTYLEVDREIEEDQEMEVYVVDVERSQIVVRPAQK
ncbi:P-loop containing nucleoside triphosphate hydrolase protein [Trichodelitschia bisporula]|uniref:P-loop containing nucleoside triphosphate hydrolase protein n=1 Tax=Trichodelitschia bisporula TaxID=703511 RepID=A0A6G1I6D4_9PEZI|nr:P-loop containing nucleoside triphosphate hydrolase protein [Trichodelitschia bisporula]